VQFKITWSAICFKQHATCVSDFPFLGRTPGVSALSEYALHSNAERQSRIHPHGKILAVNDKDQKEFTVSSLNIFVFGHRDLLGPKEI
jgi:hypothetical protein